MKNTPGSRRTTSAAVVHATDTGHRYESRDLGSPLPTLATLLYDITDDIFEVGRLVVLRGGADRLLHKLDIAVGHGGEPIKNPRLLWIRDAHEPLPFR
jgi:hypothetical protein